MTSGERAVWAAEFVSSMAQSAGLEPAPGHRMEAAGRATELVIEMRQLKDDALHPDVRAMVDDMLSNGRDR